MLEGTLYYVDSEFGTVMYSVKARDSFDGIKLYIENNYSDYTMMTNAQNIFDKSIDESGLVTYPYEDANTTDKRRLDIKKANKYKTNIVNREFCTRIASLIRYVDITGKKNYNKETGLDFTFSDTRVVELEGIGTVEYKTGLVTEMHVQNKFLKLDLTTVSDSALENNAIFKELKLKDNFGNILSTTPISNVGFKLSEEFLGFPYTPPIAEAYVSTLGMYETIEEVIANNPDKNTDWILNRKYEIVSDETLEEIIAMFMAHNGFVAFDTETSGLKINFKSRTNEADQLVGVVLSIEKGTGYYFPLQHKCFKNLCDGDHFYFMDKYMRPILEKKQIITHNVSFDWKVAYIYDINLNVTYDTMIAFGVTKRYEEESFEYGLKALARNIFGLDMFDLDDFVTGSSFSDSNVAFWDLPYEIVRRYAPADADMTLSLYEYIEHHNILDKYNARRIFELEIDFAKCVAYSEFFGYHIAIEQIPQLNEEILGNMEKYKKIMFEIAGKEFNPNSPKQLVEIIYDELKIPPVENKRSTSKDLLGVLAKEKTPDGEAKYPFIVALKKYRDNEGIYKNFLKRLPEFSTSDGFIFPRVLPLGTTTGRCSVNNPNYQSYNDAVKKKVTPREGYLHLDSDFSQIEQRVLVSMANTMFPDGKPLALMTDFDDADMDYHQYQAARMFNVPYASVTKAMRQQSKGINFGLPYGMGDESLGGRIFGEKNKENTAKASVLRQKFFQGQEKIEMFFERVRGEGVRNGFTSTKFGRRRYYHKGKFTVNEIRRQAGNHVIQGTSADIYKLAVVSLFRRVCKEGWLGLVLFNTFVHDEILLEVHKSINMFKFMQIWREEFEVKIEGFCRLYAGVGVGKCWYDAKKQDLPPQYSDILISEYREDMDWDEDIEGFVKHTNAGLAQYLIDRVRDYILDPESQNQVIKPAIFGILGGVKDDIVKEIKEDDALLAEYNAMLGGEYITKEDGCTSGDLQHWIQIYCKYYNIDYNNVSILAPSDVVVGQSSQETQEEEVKLEYDDIRPIDLLHNRVKQKGYTVDFNTRNVYLGVYMLGNINILDNVIGLAKETGLYKINIFLNTDVADAILVTERYLDSADLQLLGSLYGNLISQGGRMVNAQ